MVWFPYQEPGEVNGTDVQFSCSFDELQVNFFSRVFILSTPAFSCSRYFPDLMHCGYLKGTYRRGKLFSQVFNYLLLTECWKEANQFLQKFLFLNLYHCSFKAPEPMIFQPTCLKLIVHKRKLKFVYQFHKHCSILASTLLPFCSVYCCDAPYTILIKELNSASGFYLNLKFFCLWDELERSWL